MKRFLTLCLAVLIVALSVMPVSAQEWYDESIAYLKGIAAVKDDLKPEQTVTFAQFAEMFALTATYEHGENAADVLKAQGFVKDADGLSAEKPITRKDALRIVMRGLGVDGDDFIAQAKEQGIVVGYPDGSVGEDRPITFAEASQFSYKYRKIREQAIADEPVPLYTADDFFKLPESLGYSITKDGKSLVYAAPWENRLNIFKKDIQTGKITQITKLKDRGIAGYFVKDNTIVYSRDFGGDENYHLFKTDKNGKEIDLTPYDKTRVMPLDSLDEAKIKDEVLIQMNKDNKQVFSVYKLNVVTGETTKIIDNDGRYSGFLTDTKGNVRLAGFSDGVNTGYYYRDSEEDEFELVATYNFKQTVNPIMFAEDNQTIYAISNIDRNTAALVKIDPKTGEDLELIYQNDKVDVMGASSGREPGTLGLVYYYTDKLNFIFFDDETEKLYKECQDVLGTTAQIGVGRLTEDWNFAILSVASDVNRGVSYLYDRKAKELTQLTDTNTVDTNDMSPMIPISYKSRDGLTIHGYLTIPKNAEPYKLPVVVNPHGGPWMRDVWGYNPEVQFLANRGYAVLQVNFRGSTGYGREFLEAGYKQWGLDMQNDITDGVEWLKSIGIADPDRVGIYGASYGGYATLAGVAFTPDLYAAAVDYVGVSNLFTFLYTIPPYWESMREQMYEMVGNPETDKELFERTSPALHADKIKTPLFVAQGANDPRVNKAESDQMVEALRERGVEVTYMVKDDEGHGFMNYENQLDFYKEMEKFFAEYLGGRASE